MNSFCVIFASAVLSINAFSLIPPPPGNECLSPNGEQGLGPALRELVDLIPLTKLLKIHLNAVSNDPEVKEAFEYIESNEFKEVIQVIHDTKEFENFMEYLCAELYFDSYFYLNALGDILNYPPMFRPTPKPTNNNNHRITRRSVASNKYRSGFSGYLQDIHDALPIKEMKEAYEKRIETDKYLRLAIEKLGSKEFQQLAQKVRAQPEYQHALQRLRDVHVDIDTILNRVYKFLGWKVNY